MSPARLTGFAVAVLAAAAAAWWLLAGPDVAGRDLSGLSGDVDRGAYVARLSGCIACHTRPGGAVLAGGAAIETEFGQFHAPNITPDPEKGIGAWTLADFARALTAGEAPDGRHYYPAFPYTFYTRLRDQDIVDLWAAVRSVPAVAEEAPEHELRFPFSIRAGLGAWKRLYFEPGPPEPVAGRSDQWKRGRYLAEGPAHCAACHTPRTVAGALAADDRYGGGRGPGDEKVPPITSRALADANWSVDDLVYALRTGITPSGDLFGGSMAEVVRGGTRFWSDDDLRALATYLLAEP